MKLSKDAVELWAKEFDKVKKQPLMSKEDAEFFLKCAILERQEDQKEIEKELEKGKLGICSMIWKRVKYCHTYKITPAVCLFLGSMENMNPAKSTMFANYFQYKTHITGINLVDFDFLSFRCFSMGFPTEQEWERMWNLQKLEVIKDLNPDNVLDYIEAQESIRN